MPIGMVRIRTSTGNPRPIPPDELEGIVRQTVEGAGAEFVAIYFSVDSPTAVAVVKDLDDFVKIKAVTSALHATSFEKFVGTQDALEAAAQAAALRPPEGT